MLEQNIPIWFSCAIVMFVQSVNKHGWRILYRYFSLHGRVLEKLRVAQLLKKAPAFYRTRKYILCQQQPFTGLCPEINKKWKLSQVSTWGIAVEASKAL